MAADRIAWKPARGREAVPWTEFVARVKRANKSPHRIDRFRDALENAFEGALIFWDGSIFRGRRRHQRSFKFNWRAVLQGGVEPLLVVDLHQEVLDAGPRLFQAVVFLSMHFFVLQGLHEGFAFGVGLSRQLRLIRTL